MDSDSHKLTLTMDNITRGLVVRFDLKSGGKVSPVNIPILLQKLKRCLEESSKFDPKTMLFTRFVADAKQTIFTKFVDDVYRGPLPLFIMYVHHSCAYRFEFFILFCPSLSLVDRKGASHFLARSEYKARFFQY